MRNTGPLYLDYLVVKVIPMGRKKEVGKGGKRESGPINFPSLCLTYYTH